MTDKIQDIDYLYSCARVKALEKNLISRERLERMCDAKTHEDAFKVLTECGYGEFPPESGTSDVDRALRHERINVFDTIAKISPEKRLIGFFLLKYDYHNIKAIIKAEASSQDAEPFLSDSGTIPKGRLETMMRESDFTFMTPVMKAVVVEARDLIARTFDPQAADIVLDRATFAEMLLIAKKCEIPFLKKYAALLIDSANLRAAVRIKRMGKSFDSLKNAFIEGGEISFTRLNADITPDLLEKAYATSPLYPAAVLGGAVLRGEADLSALDLKCENAVVRFLQNAKYAPLGPNLLIAYVAAKEAELTAVRTIMTGRFSGLPAESIMERLRDSYV